MPPIFYEFWLKPTLLKRAVGTKEEIAIENIKFLKEQNEISRNTKNHNEVIKLC